MVKHKSASDLIFPLCRAVSFCDEKQNETERALSLTVAATVPAFNRIPWLRCTKKKTVRENLHTVQLPEVGVEPTCYC